MAIRRRQMVGNKASSERFTMCRLEGKWHEKAVANQVLCLSPGKLHDRAEIPVSVEIHNRQHWWNGIRESGCGVVKVSAEVTLI